MEKILLFGIIIHWLISGFKKLKSWKSVEKKNVVVVPLRLKVLMMLKDCIVTPIIFLALIYHYNRSSFIYPKELWLWCYVIAIILVVCSIALKTWAYEELADEWSGGLSIYDNHQLITSGPYNYVRHPIYTSYLMLTIAFILSGNVILIFLGMLFFWINTQRRVQEEDVLEQSFDTKYKRYKYDTGCYVPFILKDLLIFGGFILWFNLSLIGMTWEVLWIMGFCA